MKFTLRDLFWLLLVVATFCAWYLQQEQRAAELRANYAIKRREMAHEMTAQWRELDQLKADYAKLQMQLKLQQTNPTLAPEPEGADPAKE